MTFWYRAELFLYINNIKKFIFCTLIEPCQDYILSFQSTWLSNYLKITFIIIKAHVNKKTCWKMFLQLCLLIWSAKFSFHNLIKKSFFYDVLLRLLHFRTNPQYSIICQSNFVFIQHSIICEKHLPFYIFPLLEVKKMFL